MGRSGCGKTTLLHMIAGISRPDAGSVRIDGCDIARLPKRAATGFGPTKSAMSFKPSICCRDSRPWRMCCWACRSPAAGDPIGRGICSIAWACGIAFRTARAALGRRAATRGGRASLGQSPEAAFGRRPTANVDTRHQQQIIDLVRDTCREENVSLLLVTHTPEVAEQFDRVEHLEI